MGFEVGFVWFSVYALVSLCCLSVLLCCERGSWVCLVAGYSTPENTLTIIFDGLVAYSKSKGGDSLGKRSNL